MILGIDPGLEGAMAVLDVNKKIVAIEAIPLKMWRKSRKKTDAKKFEAFIQSHNIEHCILEELGMRRGQALRGLETQAVNWGIIIAILDRNNVPYETLAPVHWQKKVRIGGGGRTQTKRESLAMANQLYPALDLTEKQDGVSDAILIARSYYV